MADYIEIEDAGGVKRKINVDEIAEQFVQRIKMQHGADGSATDVSNASPLPVGDATAKALLETIDADTGAIATATGLLDNAIAGSEMQVDVVAALPAGTNAIGKLGANSGVDIGDVTLTAGSALVGDVGLGVRASGGASIFRSLDLDETEEEVKATAGQVYGYYFANRAAGERFLKFYNATAATVVVGTTAPVLTLPLPEKSAGHISLPVPAAFSTAITVAATTGIADADTGAPGANDVVLNLFYA